MRTLGGGTLAGRNRSPAKRGDNRLVGRTGRDLCGIGGAVLLSSIHLKPLLSGNRNIPIRPLEYALCYGPSSLFVIPGVVMDRWVIHVHHRCDLLTHHRSLIQVLLRIELHVGLSAGIVIAAGVRAS